MAASCSRIRSALETRHRSARSSFLYDTSWLALKPTNVTLEDACGRSPTTPSALALCHSPDFGSSACPKSLTARSDEATGAPGCCSAGACAVSERRRGRATCRRSPMAFRYWLFGISRWSSIPDDIVYKSYLSGRGSGVADTIYRVLG
jgi:hypothetical protein